MDAPSPRVKVDPSNLTIGVEVRGGAAAPRMRPTPRDHALRPDLRRSPHLRIESRPTGSGVFWLDLPDQWDPKSPWHDGRVRQAASLAIDRQAVNQAESLGHSRLTGSIIPRSFEFALPFDPPPYDPGRARQLLAEAGYPNGFDAGDFYPYPPLTAMGEALAGYLGAVGIRTRIRAMERAAFLTAWRERKLRGVLMGLNGAGGNAATRLEAFVTRTGSTPTALSPRSRICFSARPERSIERSGKRSYIRSSALCTIASCTCSFMS
jgi:ABC-type transport system substrate-binding protein